MKKKNSFADWS